MKELGLVLLPGLDGSGILFEPLLKHVPSQFRPIVISYPPDKMLSYDELLERVLAALPKETPFVLLGESFSGPLALMAAAKCPRGLVAVVLCATFIRNPMRLRIPWLRHLARPITFRLFPELSRTKALLGGYATPELLSLSRKALADVTPQVLAYRVREVLRVDVLSQLQACPVPILYLRGERDRVVPKHNASEIAKGFPSLQISEIPSPHWVLQTQPQLAAVAITTFIENILAVE